MKSKTTLILFASLLMPLIAMRAFEVENLRCEYFENPLGIDVAAPLPSLPWGRCTTKKSKSGTTLYLHVFEWPKEGELPEKPLDPNATVIKPEIIGESKFTK